MNINEIKAQIRAIKLDDAVKAEYWIDTVDHNGWQSMQSYPLSAYGLSALAADHDRLDAKEQQLRAALEKIIEMNRQHAEDQYGDREKAESWSCVTVARAALA